MSGVTAERIHSHRPASIFTSPAIKIHPSNGWKMEMTVRSGVKGEELLNASLILMSADAD